MKLIDKITGCK